MSGKRKNGAPFSSLQLSGLFKRRQQRSNSNTSNISPSSTPFPIKNNGEAGSSPKAQQHPSRFPSTNSDSTVVAPSPVRQARRSSSHFSLLSPRNLLEGRRNEEEEVEELNPLLTEIFVNEDDVAAFREALQDDAGQQEPATTASSSLPVINALSKLGGQASNTSKSQERSDPSPNKRTNGTSNPEKEVEERQSDPDAELTGTQPTHPRKIGRIAAASDFAPVRERTHRRRRGKVDTGSREGFLYLLLRFPLLVGIFLTIALEFAAYVLIRQIVNFIEYFIAWRGKKGTLRSRLRKARNATEWRNVALELDEYLGYEAWKTEDASGLYDWILVKKVQNSLRTMRENDDADGVMGVLELCLRNNFAGTENFRLYSETFFGTKYLIESYLSEVEEALNYIQHTEKVSPQSKRSFYRGVQKNMGRSALCLSGGGSFGYYHVGLVKALLDSNLLPSIITGTSAGGLIAALACTRTNEELKGMLVPELADRITACEEPFLVWGPRAYRTGARFDTVQWAEKAQFFTRGSMTFAEAYAKTGKVLNISVIPSDRHSPVKLLNYHTAPNCIIWSSLLASAAVPGIMNPVCLMQKDKNGQAIPWNWGHRFKDGSLRVDIPLQDLHSLFNVNYPIVSQVNPHVHLFFFAPKGMPGRPVAHRKGKGWRGGFILSASEHVLKLHLSMNFKIIRDLDLLPSILGQDWSTVFLQQFGGAVTIWPKTRAWDWVRILSDPDRKELSRMINVGLGVTFPKLHMIENRVRLERAIESGRKSTRQALRLLTSGGGVNSKNDGINSQVDTALPSASMDIPSITGGGLATQSDTDGTGDDFFSAKGVSAHSSANTTMGNVKLRAQLRRLQGLRGMSRLNGGGEGEEEDEGSTHDEFDEGAAGGTATPVTPGELPRHIRSRSMGLDEEDEERSRSQGSDVMRNSTSVRNTPSAKRNNKSNSNSNSKWSARGSMSMRWLNDRERPEESSSSSSEEGN